MTRLIPIIALLVALGSDHVQAAPVTEQPPAQTETARALSVGAAVVPGLLVHGLGHLTAGETETGYALLAMEAVGVGLTLGGITGLALTGAAHEWVTPSIGLTGAGVGLFVGSYLLDVYGVINPDGGFGAPPAALPWATVHMGYRHVVDPVRAIDGLMVVGGRLSMGPIALTPTLWRTPDGTDQRMEFGATYRLWGPPQERWGHAIDLDTALVRHRNDPGGFAINTGEVVLTGRWDMGALARTLTGAYTRAGFGLAGGVIDYDDIGQEPTSLLLMRFEMGVFLGRGPTPRGLLVLYYDHRHDGYAAGMKSTGVGSGPLGHVGARLDLDVWGPWGLTASVEGGSALVSGLSLSWKGVRQ